MFPLVRQRLTDVSKARILLPSRSRFFTPLASSWQNRFSCQQQNCVAAIPYPRCLSTDTNRPVGTPTEAQVVIAGGGVIGCSVAYHLAKLGWKDIVLLEQGSISCGTTWHAAGLLSKLRATDAETKISDYAAKLYPLLEEETGLDAGFKKCGGLLLAQTSDRWTYVKRLAVQARSYGLDVELLSPREAQELWPFMRVDDIKGALWLPEEGVISPTDLCRTLARGATNQGVRILEKVAVEEVVTDGFTVQSVKTNQGQIRCEIFINCAGLWARELGLKCKPVVNIPLQAVEHFYILTKSVKASHMLPLMRDPDGLVYFREWGGGLCTGGYEPNAKPCFYDNFPEKFEFQLLSEDWDQFEVLMKAIVHRVPQIENAEIIQMVNGPESFTPDDKSIIGEAPNIRNYFVAVGLCSMGICNAAGIGDILSQWITHGSPPMNVSHLDIKRFSPHHNNKRYLYHRVKGIVEMLYALPYPRKEFPFARRLKSSVLYGLLDEAGASWGERMGWETTNWFANHPKDNRSFQGTFGKPHWMGNVEQECRASQEGVAVIDLTSAGLLELNSLSESGCVDLLQFLCTNNVGIPIGDVVHTSMLTENGGYEVQCSIIRKATNRFVILTKPILTTRTESWLLFNKDAGNDVTITNTQSYCTILGVLGPRSVDVLQSLTLTSLNDEDFPLNSSKRNQKTQCNAWLKCLGDSCYCGIRPFGVIRVPFQIGDLDDKAIVLITVVELDCASDVLVVKSSDIFSAGQGFQVFVPNDQVVVLYKALMCAGENHCIRNMGWYALDNLRVEKGLPVIGTELSPSVTPYDVGMQHSIDFNKEFVGKKALHKLKDNLPKLIHMRLKQHDQDNFPWGAETILHNGDVIGTVTSAGYNFEQEHPVCLGLVTKRGVQDVISSNSQLNINIAGKLYEVDVILKK